MIDLNRLCPEKAEFGISLARYVSTSDVVPPVPLKASIVALERSRLSNNCKESRNITKSRASIVPVIVRFEILSISWAVNNEYNVPGLDTKTVLEPLAKSDIERLMPKNISKLFFICFYFIVFNCQMEYAI